MISCFEINYWGHEVLANTHMHTYKHAYTHTVILIDAVAI